MSSPQRFKANFDADTVDRLRAVITEGLAEAGVPESDAYSLLTVADEVFCNVVEHSGATWVEVEVFPKSDTVCISVRDDGMAFDPTAQVSRLPDPSSGAPVERKLGLYMLGQLSGQCQYHRVDGLWNELTFEIKK